MELTKYSVSELSRMLSGKEVSSEDLTRAYLKNIEAKEPEIGAYITVTGEEALAKAKEQKGSALTAAEKETTLKLLHLTSKLENLGNLQNGADFAVKTNSLTARGGFQTGVRSDGMTQYNSQMMYLTKSQLRVAEEIRQQLNDIMGD